MRAAAHSTVVCYTVQTRSKYNLAFCIFPSTGTINTFFMSLYHELYVLPQKSEFNSIFHSLVFKSYSFFYKHTPAI